MAVQELQNKADHTWKQASIARPISIVGKVYPGPDVAVENM